MAVLKNRSSLEQGLDGLSQVLGGALKAEETNYRRDIDERNFNENVRQFDESTRRFDVSFSEQVREFNDNMAYNIEQADLTRRHQVRLQDDRFAQQTKIQDDEQDFLTVEKKRDRAVEYFRIQENVKMQNDDRALRWEKEKFASQRQYLGDSDSYDSLPGAYLVGADGQRYAPNNVKIKAELEALAAGDGSGLFGTTITQESAKTYLDSMAKDPNFLTAFAEGLASGKFLPLEENTNKESGLQRLMMKSAGGQEAYNALTEEEKRVLRGATIRDLNNVGLYERRIISQEAAIYQARREAELGSSVYNNGDPLKKLGATAGMPFVWDSNYNYPVPTSGTNSPVSRLWERGNALAQEASVAVGSAPTEEDALSIIANYDDRLKEKRDMMRDQFISEGIDPSWADKMYESQRSFMLGEQVSSDAWALPARSPGNKGKGDLSNPSIPSNVISTPFGQFIPGEIGYDAAVKYMQQNASTTDAEKKSSKSEVEYNKNEAALKEIEKLKRREELSLIVQAGIDAGTPITQRQKDNYLLYGQLDIPAGPIGPLSIAQQLLIEKKTKDLKENK